MDSQYENKQICMQLFPLTSTDIEQISILDQNYFSLFLMYGLLFVETLLFAALIPVFWRCIS